MLITWSDYDYTKYDYTKYDYAKYDLVGDFLKSLAWGWVMMANMVLLMNINRLVIVRVGDEIYEACI